MTRIPTLLTVFVVLVAAILAYRLITIPAQAEIAAANVQIESLDLEAAQNRQLVSTAAQVGSQHARMMKKIGPRLSAMESSATALFTIEMPRIAACHHLAISLDDPIHDRRPGDIRTSAGAPPLPPSVMAATAQAPGLVGAPSAVSSPVPVAPVAPVLVPLNALGVNQQDAGLLASSFVGTERIVKLTGSYRDLLQGIDELPRGRSLLLIGAPSLTRDTNGRITAAFHTIVYSPRPEVHAIVGGSI